MNKVQAYREHAKECRKLAAGMTGEQRQHLLEMATTWDRLAQDRETMRPVADEPDFPQPS